MPKLPKEVIPRRSIFTKPRSTAVPASADVHYKLGLIYDDKLNDPLNALHHFKRFLALEPTGKRAAGSEEFHETRRAALC